MLSLVVKVVDYYELFDNLSKRKINFRINVLENFGLC